MEAGSVVIELRSSDICITQHETKWSVGLSVTPQNELLRNGIITLKRYESEGATKKCKKLRINEETRDFIWRTSAMPAAQSIEPAFILSGKTLEARFRDFDR